MKVQAFSFFKASTSLFSEGKAWKVESPIAVEEEGAKLVAQSPSKLSSKRRGSKEDSSRKFLYQ